ncbi:MAG: TolC family protein [Moraxellaceae bacterium]|nr:MAG: TolC family protein [Moraxellaceae bacterium]
MKSTIDVQKKRQQFDNDRAKLSLFWIKGPVEIVSFNHVDANLFSLPPLVPLDKLIHQLDNNPDIAALNDQAQVRAAELRQAQSERATNINWNAGIRHLQANDDSAFVMGMSVPLGSANRAAGAITTASANQNNAELERDTALIKLQAHLTALHSAYEQALTEVNSLREDVLPLLTQAMRATTSGFNQGRYSYLELNLAQREVLDVQLMLIDAAARTHILASEIERITGAGLNTTASVNSTARDLP